MRLSQMRAVLHIETRTMGKSLGLNITDPSEFNSNE